MKICIDPGHGGKDSGASGNGLLEKSVNLSVALKLKNKLQVAGITIIMTRENDTYLDLTARANISNNAHADYYLSIHHNAGGGSGYDVIYSISGGKSKELAGRIASEFTEIGQKQHGLFSKKGLSGMDYYAVIRQTNAPAVISEYGFIDSEDAKTYNTDVLQEKEAEALYEAICKQCNINIPIVSTSDKKSEIPPIKQNIQPLIEKHPVGYDAYLPGRRIIHLDDYTYISIEDGSITFYAKGKQPKQLI